MPFLIQPRLILLAILSPAIAADPIKCLPYTFDDINVFKDVFKEDKIDPLFIGTVNADYPDVAIVAEDLVYTGLGNAALDEFHINFITNLTRVVFHTDIIGKCLYKIKGNLFSIPVDGHGPFIGIFNKYYLELVMPFDIEKDENGQDFINLEAYYSWYDIRGNGELQYADIYNGDPKRNETIHNLINHNFRIFGLRVGEPFFIRVIDSIFKIFKSHMKSMPLSTFLTC